jgi:hypothetical protein
MATPTYDPIASHTLGSAAGSYTFTSIPQTYTDLIMVMAGGSNGSLDLGWQANGDTSTNYSYTRMSGNGSTASGNRVANNSIACFGWMSSSTTQGTQILQIFNYANTTMFKTSLGRGGMASNLVVADAGLWRNTAAITSLTITNLNGQTFNSGTTFTLYGITTAPTPTAKATGGTITYDVSYTYHTFTSSGTFTPLENLTAEVIAIAGGGGSSPNYGGGAGAGGLVYTPTALFSLGVAHTVTVGGGGAPSSNEAVRGSQGANSNITGGVLSLTQAIGGGFGGARFAVNSSGGNGGSGGGAAFWSNPPSNGGSGTSGQGNNGGSKIGGGSSTGAGGGAGAVGGTDSGASGGVGGNGLSTYSSWGLATNTGQNISGTRWYAGGGGGGAESASGAGGNGGGGNGAPNSGTAGNGLANTGGGGGGVGGGGGTPGAGGSGLVIVRYAN